MRYSLVNERRLRHVSDLEHSPRRADPDQNMQSTLSRGDALRCVQSGGAADRDQVQQAMIQEHLEVSVRLGCVLLRKPGDSRLIAT
jgi:hypothetical protein